MEKKYRNQMGMFDFIKGIAIFEVVLFHSVGLWYESLTMEQVYIAILFIGPFWMAVFIMASGYWFVEKDIKEYTKKRLFSFLKDYTLIGVVTTVCYAAIHYLRFHSVKSAIKGSIGVVLAFLTGSKTATTIGSVDIYDIGPSWFLMALCWGDILLNVILKIKKKEIIRVVVALLALVGLVIGNQRWLPYCISFALIAVLGLYVGYELKKNKYLIRKWKITDYIMSVVFYLGGIVFVLFGFDFFELEAFGLEIIVGLLAGIGLLRLGLLLGSKKNKVIDFFKKLGRYTYWILIVHTVEMLSINWRLLLDMEWVIKLPLLGLVVVLLSRWTIIGLGCLFISKAGRILARRRQHESA